MARRCKPITVSRIITTPALLTTPMPTARGGWRASQDRESNLQRRFPQKIEIWDAQAPEYNSAYECTHEAYQDIAGNEAAGHRRYSSDGAVSNQAVLLGRQAHGGGVHVILPGKHEAPCLAGIPRQLRGEIDRSTVEEIGKASGQSHHEDYGK